MRGTKLTEAINLLEKADDGAFDLNVIVAQLLPNAPPSEVAFLDYTRSLDATENALPSRWEWCSMSRNNRQDRIWTASIHPASGVVSGMSHKSLPIARTLAVLKAHLTEMA